MITIPTTSAAALAALTAYAEAHPPAPTRPLTDADLARECWLEDRAERRAEERSLPVGGREADRAAELYYAAVAS